MDATWLVKYLTEFIGTALLIILGNGAVANVELKGTKGYKQGWMIIAWGYGIGVMLPSLAFGNISAQINPAFTLGLAVSGLFPWAQVPYYLLAQLLGAMVGQLLVVMVYRPYYLKTDNSNAILGSFATIDNVDDGSRESHVGAWINGFLNELVGSFVLFFGALGLTTNFFGAESIGYIKNAVLSSAAQQGQTISATDPSVTLQSNLYTYGSKAIGFLVIGFVVMVLVASLGGPSGPALNPARDLGPRLIHQFLPKSILGEGKKSSKWWYAWVPVLAPIIAAVAAVALFKVIYIK